MQTAQTRSRLFGAKGEGRESEERAPLWKIEFFLLSSLFLESEKVVAKKLLDGLRRLLFGWGSTLSSFPLRLIDFKISSMCLRPGLVFFAATEKRARDSGKEEEKKISPPLKPQPDVAAEVPPLAPRLASSSLSFSLSHRYQSYYVISARFVRVYQSLTRAKRALKRKEEK